MNSLARKLILTISVSIALLFAFAAGYLTHDWLPAWIELPVPSLDAASTSPEGQADLDIYWQVWRLLEQDFYGDDPAPTERMYGSIRGLAQSYNDPYTFFVEPQPRELERDQLRGRFGGIGSWIDQVDEGYRLRPMPGKPAEAAGLQAGDLLLSVDDTPITADTPVDAVTALIRGPVDTQVCLTVARVDAPGVEAQRRTVCMVRTEFETPSMQWRLLDEEAATAHIGYIKQTLFSERSPEEMRTALQELSDAGADRYILDLRGNPGGLVDAAVQVADLWLDGGLVLLEKHADGSEQKFTVDPGRLAGDAPLVVIVDGASASASEILAGALQDRQRAILVGEQTFGKGSVQLVHELADQSSLHVTTAHWFTPDRHAIEGVGLTPDVIIQPGSDPLPQAVEIVQELIGQAQSMTVDRYFE